MCTHFHSSHYPPLFISISSQAYSPLSSHSPLSLTLIISRMTPEPATQYHHHGRLRVAGGVIPDAITAYRTYGNPANLCIVFPTCYGGKLDSKCSHAKHFSTDGQVDSGLLGQTYLVGDDKVGIFLNAIKRFQLTIGPGIKPSEIFRGHFCSIFQWRGVLLRLLIISLTNRLFYQSSSPSNTVR